MRARPVLAGVSGFGVFASLALMMFGSWPLDTLSEFGLQILVLLVGLGLAWWAPLGRGATTPETEVT
jgi:hypothetical protein